MKGSGSRLLARYMDALGLTSMRLAERSGALPEQVYAALKTRVGAKTADKIVSYVADEAGLSEEEALELKADVMGTDDPVRAYLGTASRAQEVLNVGWDVAAAVMGGEELPNATGRRVHARLKAVGAPEIVMERIGQRTLPTRRTKIPAPRHSMAGADMKGLKRSAKEHLAKGKPRTASALERTGLLHKELRAKVGITTTAFRNALYGRASGRNAAALAEELAKILGLSAGERDAIREELEQPPKENS